MSALGDAPEQSALENELAVLLVESLNLEIAPSEIAPTAPLYGEGLGLDSIDILEVALEFSTRSTANSFSRADCSGASPTAEMGDWVDDKRDSENF